jgi:hypothetical protein
LGPISSALDSVKNDGSPRNFDRLFGISRLNPLTAVAIAAVKPIKKTSQIQSVQPLDTITIHREIAWVTTVLASSSELLANFVRLRDEYATTLCSGNFDGAEDFLDEIDKECGLSLWTVENRISLAALSGGFEKQKAYINGVLARERRTFVSFFASNVSERNEARVSKFSFESRLRERAKTWKIKPDQQSYIFFKLLGMSALTQLEAADILSFEAASSMIDLYETFLEIMITAQASLSRYKGQVAAQLEKLGRIDDACLVNLRLIYSDELPSGICTSEYLNAFLSGRYTQAAQLAANRLREYPNDAMAILITSRLMAMNYEVSTGGNRFTKNLLSLLCAFLKKDKGCDETIQSLERFALNFRSLAISASINSLIHESSADLIGKIPAAMSMRSKYMSLPVCLSLVDATRAKELIAKTDLHDATWQYERVVNFGDEAVDVVLSEEARSFGQIESCKRIGTPNKAFSYLEHLSKAENVYFRQESSILQAWFLLEDGDVHGSILHSVRVAITKPTLLRSLPIIELLENRGFRDLKQLEREPALSIAFFLYITLTRENTKDVALKVAWKQFHKAHGVTKPSELKPIGSKFDSSELLFFLRNICTQEIMELSSAFNSPADLDKERLHVCIALAGLDPDHAGDYDDEILELTRRLSIEDGVQQVESSRVYVDMLGLQRCCHQNLNELFMRYIDYAGAALQASAEEIERSIVAILKKDGLSGEIIEFLDAYDISADSLLAELIEECAKAFLTLPRFGLDAFLGSRVRHGSLEGAFRSPLEKRKLITKIDSSSNQYESNAYWLNAIDSGATEERTALNKALNTFSTNIDALLDTAINRFVHVRSTENPDGLITLWPDGEKARQQLLKSWLVHAKANLSKETTIEQLVEFCATTYFWPALKTSLSQAADFVTKTLAQQIHSEFFTLERSAQKFTPNLHGFFARINAAKSDLEGAAAKVAKWFAPPQFASVGSSYLLKTGIEIGITSLRHIRPHFDAHVEWVVNERANVLLNPTAFQIINDVAFLIFGNILKHSGFFDSQRTIDNRPAINIWLRWNEPNIVEVEVQSAISPEKDISSIELNVISAKERIRLGQFDSVERQRNKTGLVRLASALNYEKSHDKMVDFGIMEGSRFRVVFAVPVYFLTGQPN